MAQGSGPQAFASSSVNSWRQVGAGTDRAAEWRVRDAAEILPKVAKLKCHHLHHGSCPPARSHLAGLKALGSIWAWAGAGGG